MRKILICLIFVYGCALPPQPDEIPGAEIHPIIFERVPNISSDLFAKLETEPPKVSGISANARKQLISERALLNRVRMQYFSEVESAYYRNSPELASRFRNAFGLEDRDWPKGLPRVCIAMSGGGTRSAGFSIGALQYLSSHSDHLLDSVDIVSAVSGGSYASSWFYAHQIDSNVLADSLLDDGGPYIEYLDENVPNFVNPVIGTLAGAAIYPFQLVFAVGSILPGVPQVDIGGIGYYTELNRLLFNSQDSDGFRRPTFREIGSLVSSKNLPLPIISGTVRSTANTCTKEPGSETQELANAVFEMTPFRFGTDGIGYTDAYIDEEFLGAVMVSGAALDRPSGFGCAARRLIGLQTGVSFRRFITSSTMAPARDPETNQRAIEQSIRQSNVHLIDGGFSDNLATYPLVKRLCQTILIVDAEHDPMLEYESYRILKDRLRLEHGLEFSVPVIDELTQGKARVQSKGCLNSGNDFLADKLNISCALNKGKVGLVPYKDEGNLEIDVLYLKLSLDDSKIKTPDTRKSPYRNEVVDYYSNDVLLKKDSGCKGSGIWSRCRFPQQSTAKQSLASEEFRAYRYLSQDILIHHGNRIER